MHYKINNDDEMSENGYIRRENSWILDENINMLCNVKETAYKLMINVYFT